MNLNRPKSNPIRAIIALFIVAITLIILDNSGSLEQFLGFVRDPYSRMGVTFGRFTTLLRRPADLNAAYQEIQALQEQVNTLQRENDQLRSLQAEYDQLLALLNRAQETPNFQRQIATVIGRGPNPLFRDLIIDKGTDDGVRVGMPVESGRGLVGIVHRASRNAAQVRLVIDAGSRIPARLNVSRGIGIVRGQGASGLLSLEWVDLEAQVGVNEVVLSSGLEGATRQEIVPNRFPSDIVIGRVVEIQRNPADLFQTMVVQPVVDFASLETVFVITSYDPIDTSTFETTTP